MEFWSIEHPTRTLTYTLTVSAPVLPEEWLVPLEHDDPLSPKDEKELLETIGQVTTIVEKDSTATKSPWDVILNYTAAPKGASVTATPSFETWSKRARARKSTGKAQNGKRGAGGSAGMKNAVGGSGDPVVVGGADLSTLRGVGEGGGAGMSELYRILQPGVANGLTSGKPFSRVIATPTSSSVRLSSQTAAPQSAESAIPAGAAVKNAESANKINTTLSQSPFPFTGSSTPVTVWNGSISPTGSEKIVTSSSEIESNRSTLPPQAVSVSNLNGALNVSQVSTVTISSHQPIISSVPQPMSLAPQTSTTTDRIPIVSSIPQASTTKERIPIVIPRSVSSKPKAVPTKNLHVPVSLPTQQRSVSSKPQASTTKDQIPVVSLPPQASATKDHVSVVSLPPQASPTKDPPVTLSTQQSVSSKPQLLNSTAVKESLPQQSIPSLPQLMANSMRDGSVPQQSSPKILASSASESSASQQTVVNGSTAVPIITTASALSSRPVAAAMAPHVSHPENPLPISAVSHVATTMGSTSTNSNSQLAVSCSTSTTVSTSANQANAGSNQVSQAPCNTASNPVISGAPLIVSTSVAGSSGVPTKLSSQTLSTSGSNDKISRVCVPMAKSNGALPEAFLEEIASSAVFSSFISPQVHVVKDDAVSATLMFANVDSAETGSGSSFEVDIVKVQNDKPTVVAKEVDDVMKMDLEEAGESEEKSSEDRALSMKKEDEVCINSQTVSKGEELVGGASTGVNEIEKRTDFSSGDVTTPPTTGSCTATPTSVSPMPTTPTSTMSFTSTNSSVAALPMHVPASEAKSPPTSGHRSPPTSPVIAVFQNMTYVPYISNNHLYLYPVSPHSLVGHTPSQQSHSHMQFMTTPPGLNMPQSYHQQELPLNQRPVNKFKTPRRRRKRAKSPPIPQQPHPPMLATPSSQASLTSPVTHQRNSEDAVAMSLCLQRKGEGLPVNPFTLTYTVTSSAGHSWSTNSLEGEGTLLVINVLQQRERS